MRTDVLGGVWLDDPVAALMLSALIVGLFSWAHRWAVCRVRPQPYSLRQTVRRGAVVDQLAQQRRRAVVAQAASVNRRWHEPVAERVHLDQRRQADGVAEVVGVGATREGGAGFGLDGDDARLAPFAQLLSGEWER